MSENKTYTPKGGHSGQLASALFDLLMTSFFMKKWWHLLFFSIGISSCTTQVIFLWVKILSFHPEDPLSKVSVTFRAQNQIFKSKYKQKDCRSWLRLQVVPTFFLRDSRASEMQAHIKINLSEKRWHIFLSPRRMSPFLVWGDFHACSRFARSTIPEEKWELLVV